MTNYFKSLGGIIAAFWQDILSRYLLLFTAVIFITILLIWKFRVVTAGVFVYQNFGFDPINFLIAILSLNTLLALFSHSKEKEIAHLLLIGNIIVSSLMLVLELFYLSLL